MASLTIRKAENEWERILIASDIHSVFYDPVAYRIFLGVCKEYHPDRVILNGDTLDMTGVSDHASKVNLLNPQVIEEYPFAYELDMTRIEILEPLRRAIGQKSKIELRLGNHCMRFYRPNRANAKALAELYATCSKRGETTLERLLHLHSPKIDATLSKNGSDVLYNTFTLIHGVKTSQGAPKANLLKYGSGTSGHTHRGNSYTQVMHGKQQGWWESCCLRKIEDIEYLPHGDKPDWVQGFLSLTINKRTGTFFCKTHYIIGRKCEFNGQIYSA